MIEQRTLEEKFTYLCTRSVTADGNLARMCTSVAESGEFNLNKGDEAHIFKVDEKTMVVRFD